MKLERAIKIVAKTFRMKTRKKSKLMKEWEKFTEKYKDEGFVAKRYIDFAKKFGKKDAKTFGFLKRKLGLMKARLEKKKPRGYKKTIKGIERAYREITSIQEKLKNRKVK